MAVFCTGHRDGATVIGGSVGCRYWTNGIVPYYLWHRAIGGVINAGVGIGRKQKNATTHLYGGDRICAGGGDGRRGRNRRDGIGIGCNIADRITGRGRFVYRNGFDGKGAACPRRHDDWAGAAVAAYPCGGGCGFGGGFCGCTIHCKCGVIRGNPRGGVWVGAVGGVINLPAANAARKVNFGAVGNGGKHIGAGGGRRRGRCRRGQWVDQIGIAYHIALQHGIACAYGNGVDGEHRGCGRKHAV